MLSHYDSTGFISVCKVYKYTLDTQQTLYKMFPLTSEADGDGDARATVVITWRAAGRAPVQRPAT